MRATQKILRRAIKTTSFVMILKGAVAGSVVLLALAGVTVPYLSEFFGIHHPEAIHSFAAAAGALGGALAAART